MPSVAAARAQLPPLRLDRVEDHATLVVLD
jgi:hypothetical protein